MAPAVLQSEARARRQSCGGKKVLEVLTDHRDGLCVVDGHSPVPLVAGVQHGLGELGRGVLGFANAVGGADQNPLLVRDHEPGKRRTGLEQLEPAVRERGADSGEVNDHADCFRAANASERTSAGMDASALISSSRVW